MKKTLTLLFTILHFSSRLSVPVCCTQSSRRLCPRHVSSFLSLFSISLSFNLHSVKAQDHLKDKVSSRPPLVFLSLSPTCLLVRPQGIVGFWVTLEVAWLNIKLSWELTLLLCPALNASLLLNPHPYPPTTTTHISYLHPVNPEDIDRAAHSALPVRGHRVSFSSISFICTDKRRIEGPAKFIDCWQWGRFNLKVTRKFKRLRRAERKLLNTSLDYKQLTFMCAVLFYKIWSHCDHLAKTISLGTRSIWSIWVQTNRCMF